MGVNLITWGWTGMAHDASLAVFLYDELVFAAHAERYSRIKNDKNLSASSSFSLLASFAATSICS